MKKYFILSFALLFLFSCNQFSSSENNSNNNKENHTVKKSEKKETVETTSNSLDVKYPFKSGIIKYANDAMGMKSTLTVYFDNYGAKECAVSEIDMNGQKMTMRSLVVDNYLYQLAMDQGSGSKVKVDDNFKTYLFDTEEFEKRMAEVKGKKLGTEDVLGKPCQIYSMEENGAVSKIWVWKNVVLKMTAQQDAMEMSMLAVDIKETGDLPKGIFEIPAGFNIEEIKAEDYNNEDIDDFDDENAAG
jgi:hypothetical protein